MVVRFGTGNNVSFRDQRLKVDHVDPKAGGFAWQLGVGWGQGTVMGGLGGLGGLSGTEWTGVCSVRFVGGGELSLLLLWLAVRNSLDVKS